MDLYDENRNFMGITVEQGAESRPAGSYLLYVGIWVVNSKGEILLTKRDPSKKFMPDRWENTGGHVEAGETSDVAALRELEEETGIKAAPEDLVFLGTVKFPGNFGDNYAVRKDVPIEGVRLQEGETCAAKWVTYGEFVSMCRSGEVAPSVVERLVPIRGAFDALFA